MGKTKNITLLKLEAKKKNFPNWRGNKIYCNRKGNNRPARDKDRSNGKKDINIVKTMMAECKQQRNARHAI